MPGPRPKFPHSVVLPTAPTIDATELSQSFGGVSRGRIFLWRRLYDFPLAVRSGNASLTMTADVVRWANSKNIKVTFV